MLKIIEQFKIWFITSIAIMVIGFGCLAFRGLNVGLDFKGGTQLVYEMGKEVDKAEVDTIVKKYVPDATTTTVDKTQIEVKAKAGTLDATKVSEITKELKEKYKLDDKALLSQDEVGASVGTELTKNAIIALSLAILSILIYVALRFEWEFGVAAVIALAHDLLITFCVYTIFHVPVNTPFIAAMLTIVGYSINDTVVIFDRIRENNKKFRRADHAEVANISITETFGRSIFTTFTTLTGIVAVYFFVPTVREFSFPLVIGIVSGAYSSIFIASPIWVLLKNRKTRTT